MTVQLHLGDCLDVMRTMPDASVDAVVCDPPYGILFMGRKWDYDVPSVEIWAECLRVLKPGGHLLAFAGTRTQHRMAVRIEDAGFEIRDMIAWVYGSGYPKSKNVALSIDKLQGHPNRGRAIPTASTFQACDKEREHKLTANKVEAYEAKSPEAQQWAGWGTALKPAMEMITMARKPLEGTVAANVLAHGTGGLNVDGCRVGTGDSLGGGGATTAVSEGWDRPFRHDPVAIELLKKTTAEKIAKAELLGRWPANLIHDGSDEVVGLFPQTGMSKGTAQFKTHTTYQWSKSHADATAEPQHGTEIGYGDTGSAARYFKQCKGCTEVWPNLTPEPANTAGSSSSPSRQFVAFALSDAATWALPVGSCNSLSLAPSTSATASELRQLSESVITAIQSIAPKFWQESKPAKLTLTLSHASFAVTRERTGITTITASHWKSDGSAEPVTFNIAGTNTEAGDQASAPRAFYTAKASRNDRSDGNTHPTVKPTDLMRYLCRLVTPPGGVVLDPFMGSGSTGKGALLEGFGFIGIEREAAYHAIAERRIRQAGAAGHQPSLFA